MDDFKTMIKMSVDLKEIEGLRFDRTHLLQAAQNLVAVIDRLAPILQDTQEYKYAKHVLENINDNEI
jgi:hypothetical protein